MKHRNSGFPELAVAVLLAGAVILIRLLIPDPDWAPRAELPASECPFYLDLGGGRTVLAPPCREWVAVDGGLRVFPLGSGRVWE